MKRMLSTAHYPALLDLWLLALRLMVAGYMLTHGYPKLQQLLAGEEIQFADPIGLGVTVSFVLVVFAEFFCSILVGIGLATRLAVIPLIITMLVATFVAHADDPFGKKEVPLLYLLVYGTLLVLGSGNYSVDAALRRR